jgi:hypothetical protein
MKDRTTKSHIQWCGEDQSRVVTANGGGEDRSVCEHGHVAQFTALRNEACYGRYTKYAHTLDSNK